jgi:hypothetical protein
MKIGTTVFLFKNWVGRTRENGQHDNGPIIPLLMCNGPLGDEMAGDGGQCVREMMWRHVIGGKVAEGG